ncbi:hypothetical protein COLO4_01847, partial [Corchorus olitorius]
MGNGSAPFKGSPSYTWKSSMEGKQVLEHGLKWRVGDGTLISFLHDRWLDDDLPIVKKLNMVTNDQLDSLLVSDFLDDQGWNTRKLLQYVPTDVVNRICALPARTISSTPDRVIWSLTSNGVFTTGSAYNCINKEGGNQDPHITALWKTSAQPKVLTFCWLAWNNRILCNENRFIRTLIASPICSICDSHSESVLHTLRDCKYAAAVWDIFMIDSKFANSTQLDLKTWFKFNLVDCRSIKFGDWQWPSLFVNICWQIWKWRNGIIFSNHDIPLANKLDIISKIMKEWHELQVKKPTTRDKTMTYIAWEKPKQNWVKLNTDGSWDQKGNIAAAGGLFRDSRGN